MISNGGEPLIEDGSLLLAHGRRYGLIGRNGCGKSTLLRAIANRQVAGLHANLQARKAGRCWEWPQSPPPPPFAPEKEKENNPSLLSTLPSPPGAAR